MRRALGLFLAGALSACASAEPTLAGGRTVPRGRSDVALGAAVRVPVGDLVPQDAELEQAMVFGAPSGAAPVSFVRHGITDDIDLGVEVAGSSLRGSLRGQLALSSMVSLVAGLVPHVGLLHDGEEPAFRGGALVPIVLSVDVLGLYEVWVGLRAGLEHVAGPLASRDAHLGGLRAGGMVGLAIGFRRLHVLAELAVDHELWWGRHGDTVVARSGVALTPAFGLRLRL